ncbi:calcium/calmodulin-dependent protein kinase type II delta 1 chain-like [Sycon ciliatum]|uniref:calcium/calmodulin-dependent protein kinase type II delta 1 chain-like n=1 Tax=Sycon ciliatum TaxID=27933 RepID=UPI0031F64627
MITVPTMEVSAPGLVMKDADFESIYVVKDYLGRGAFGEVRSCVSRMDGSLFAVKHLDRSRMDKEAEEVTEKEIEISHGLLHKNIVCMHQCFRSPSSYRIVMEMIHGGELFDAIVERDHYSEKDALICIRQVISALQHCHKHNIVHRDLKPENLLLSRKMSQDESMEGIVIKLVDFGLALQIPDGEKRIKADTRGTPYCIAPETLQEKPLGYPVDMWACGAVFYFMLVGMPPFWPGEGSFGQQQMYMRIVEGKYSFDNPEWESVSTRTRILVQKMLHVDQDERVCADGALKCVAGLINETKLRSLHRQEALHRMKAFRGKQRLSHNMVLQLIAARRKIMESQEEKKSPRATPAMFRRLSSVASNGDSNSSTCVSSDSDESPLCSSFEGSRSRSRRKRSKSMREQREKDIDGFMEMAARELQLPESAGNSRPATPAQGSQTATDTADNRPQPVAGSAPGANKQAAGHKSSKTQLLQKPASDRRKRSVEEIGAETIVKERRKRRISMLAELEPGNNRFIWGDLIDDADSNAPDATTDTSAESPAPALRLPDVGTKTKSTMPPGSPHHKPAVSPSVSILQEEPESGVSGSCTESDCSASSNSSTPNATRREFATTAPAAETVDSPVECTNLYSHSAPPSVAVLCSPSSANSIALSSPASLRHRPSGPCLADGVVGKNSHKAQPRAYPVAFV